MTVCLHGYKRQVDNHVGYFCQSFDEWWNNTIPPGLRSTVYAFDDDIADGVELLKGKGLYDVLFKDGKVHRVYHHYFHSAPSEVQLYGTKTVRSLVTTPQYMTTVDHGLLMFFVVPANSESETIRIAKHRLFAEKGAACLPMF